MNTSGERVRSGVAYRRTDLQRRTMTHRHSVFAAFAIVHSNSDRDFGHTKRPLGDNPLGYECPKTRSRISPYRWLGDWLPPMRKLHQNRDLYSGWLLQGRGFRSRIRLEGFPRQHLRSKGQGTTYTPARKQRVDRHQPGPRQTRIHEVPSMTTTAHRCLDAPQQYDH